MTTTAKGRGDSSRVEERASERALLSFRSESRKICSSNHLSLTPPTVRPEEGTKLPSKQTETDGRRNRDLWPPKLGRNFGEVIRPTD